MKVTSSVALLLVAVTWGTGVSAGTNPPASAEMSHRKDTLMYMTRAILMGDKQEAVRLSGLLDESMSSHAKPDQKEDTAAYAEVAGADEALRKAVLASDEIGAGKAFGDLVTACASCHKSHWGGRFFK